MDAHSLDGERLLVDAVTRESSREIVCRGYEAERMTICWYLASLGLEPEAVKDLAQEAFLIG